MTANRGSRPHLYGRYGKRLLDLLVSFAALALLLLLLLAIVLVIRIGMGSPVFFRQLRSGHQGRPFFIYKFRTMTNTYDDEGALLPDALRLTRVGRFLRSSSLDELPELVNVLRGEMSLVGPRPLLPQYIDRYTPKQMLRHEVLPGITGWAQVSGRNALDWEDVFAADLWYVMNQSFSLDLRIIAITIWKVLKREGIAQPGEATRAEFLGSLGE